MNPNWIRTGFIILFVAFLLRAGLGVPPTSTVVALGIIYLTHVLASEFGGAVKTVWTGFRGAVVMMMGVAIFLSLRLLAAKVLGLFPADSYAKVGDSGGFYWIFGGHDVSTMILWEVMFAFVAGKITWHWTQGRGKKVEALFVFSLFLLSAQIAYPEWVDSWSTRREISISLKDRGVLGTAWRGVRMIAVGKSTLPLPPPASSPATARSVAAAAPIGQCLTPCTMYVGENIEIRTDSGRSVLVRFFGKLDFIRLPKPGGDAITPEEFAPGDAEFASPDGESTPVRVRLYPVR